MMILTGQGYSFDTAEHEFFYVRCQEDFVLHLRSILLSDLKFTAASSDKEKTYEFLSLFASRHTTGIVRNVAHCPYVRELRIASNHPRLDFGARST